MKQFRFEAEIARADAVPSAVVHERVYGNVRVSAEWPEELSAPEIRVALEVLGDVDERDAPAYVELFFHDVFLILNLATPASFGGTISITGGAFRARELTFSTSVFVCASSLACMPMRDVIGWYDALHTGTRQRATDEVTTALFELLHLARGSDDEEVAIVRLARAAEALVGRTEPLRRLFELRDDIVLGRTPTFHPMHDDALDTSVEDATAEWIEVVDLAASAVIGALQERVRGS